jgi:hypothetical protein
MKEALFGMWFGAMVTVIVLGVTGALRVEAAEPTYSRAISSMSRQIKSLQDDVRRLRQSVAEMQAMPTARKELAFARKKRK